MKWISDANGNRCSVETWGTDEAAQTALDSLVDCSRCVDCSGCSDLVNAAPVQAEATAEPIIVPKIPDIHKAVYAAASNPDALRMESWHTCEKKHCRAGWVVTLAGVEGKKLEARFGTLLAAMKIYDASDPEFRINPSRFFDENDVALEDMRKLAESI